MKRCVIISAAEIKDYGKIRGFLRPDDFTIFCDGGLSHWEKLLKPLKKNPNLIIGDFDSFDFSKLQLNNSIETIKLPCEKDDTDTFFAVKEAIKRGFTDFLFLGVIGNRFDHSLCNISALIYLYNKGATATIIDDYSEMEIIGSKSGKVLVEDKYSYFSLMNIAGNVSGVTIKNAKYPIENKEIKAEYSFGISNQVLPGKTAEVSVKEGMLLLVKVF